ncbi:SHOCT domain-containing protein, partial [Mycolicibacterium sp. CBMA 295]
PDPVLTESIGGTTTVNNDARVRVWVMQVSNAGTYEIGVDGQTQGFINPRLAFGHGSAYGWLLWLFGGLIALGVLELLASLMWSARDSKRARPIADMAPESIPLQPGSAGYQPDGQAVRLEQLKTIASLRDTGALTESEFEAEKRRILGS